MNEPDHSVIMSLTGNKVAWHRDDGRWECECGETMPDKQGMFWHRQHVHVKKASS